MVFHSLTASKLTRRPENFGKARFFNYEANKTKISKNSRFWYDLWLVKRRKILAKYQYFLFFCSWISPKLTWSPENFRKSRFFNFEANQTKNKNWLTLVWFMVAKEDLKFCQRYQFFMVFHLLVASKLTGGPENSWTVRFFNYEANETKKSKIGRPW